MYFSKRHRNFIIIEQGLIPIVLNFIINGVIAWLVFRSLQSIPLWGETSIGVDLLLTGFMFPFLTVLIVSALIRAQVRSEKLPPLPTEYLNNLHWLNCTPLLFGIALGLFILLLFSVPMVAILSLGDFNNVQVKSFVIFKSLWIAALSVLIAPVIGWWALVRASVDFKANT